jgi:hypothetical protein
VGTRRRKHWGWGFEDQQPQAAQLRASAAALGEHLGMTLEVVEEPVALGAKAAIDPAGIMNPDVLIDRVP